MSSYEVEHDIPTQQSSSTPSQPPRRPDLSSFFTALERVDTSHEHHPNNSHSIPDPSEISAALRMLADAFTVRSSARTSESEQHIDPLATLIEYLDIQALNPPRELQGVSDGFLADLERVAKQTLKKGDVCSICANEFLEDQFPLVVRLGCKGRHMFDLECITPWLKVNPTCPMDREKLIKKEKVDVKKEKNEDDEEDYDDMFA